MEEVYKHKVKYYETDAMGMTHHSNYVRWLEEARVFLMDQMGYSYKKLEDTGIFSPVLSYKCEIKHSTYFDDTVEIIPKVVKYNGVRLFVEYTMKVNGKIVAICETSHCFVKKDGTPIRLNKECIELDEKFKLEFEKSVNSCN